MTLPRAGSCAEFNRAQLFPLTHVIVQCPPCSPSDVPLCLAQNDPLELWIPKGTTIATDYDRRTALILGHNYSRTPGFEPGLGGGSRLGGGNTYIYLEAVHGSATTKAGVEKLLALWQISFGFPGGICL